MRFFASVLCLGLLACANDGDPQPVTYSLEKCGPAATSRLSPQEDGPFFVGYRAWDHTYNAGAGIGERTIQVHVWYPTRTNDGPRARYLGLFPDNEVNTDADPAEPLSNCGFPLAVYSHGSQGLAGGASHLSKRLATHGWIVVAPEHTGNTLTDNLDPRPSWFNLARSYDVSAAVDNVRDLPADNKLAGLAATDRFILFGHSYGGFTAWASAGATYNDAKVAERCNNDFDDCTPEVLEAYTFGGFDPRIAGSVPMAGTYQTSWFGDTGFKAIKIPILQMTGSLDPVGADTVWDLVSGLDFTWMEIEGGCHETFNLGSCDTFNVETGFQIVDTFGLAFARKHLLGDTDDEVTGILDGSVSISDAVRVEKKK